MHDFTPLSALAGGALIGLAASMTLLFNGRIMGMSGIFAGTLVPRPGDWSWRASFLLGMLVGGGLLLLMDPAAFGDGVPARSTAAVIAAGLLVGIGTRMGSGCTSGHGICGLTRLSPRSAVAVASFMATGFATAAVVTQLLGGTL